MGQIINFDDATEDEFYDELWCPECGGSCFALRIYPVKDKDILKVKCLNKECGYTAELTAEYE